MEYKFTKIKKLKKDSKPIKDDEPIDWEEIIYSGEIVDPQVDCLGFKLANDDLIYCIYIDYENILKNFEHIYEPRRITADPMTSYPGDDYYEWQMDANDIWKVSIYNEETRKDQELPLTEEDKHTIMSALEDRDGFMPMYEELLAEQKYPSSNDYYEDSKSVKDDKLTNDNIIKWVIQLQNSLRGAHTISEALYKQMPNQKPSTNEEKELYNGKMLSTLDSITTTVASWYKELEEYKKKLSTAHIVAEEILEEFPLKARNELRNSTNIDETYKSLVEDLKNRYNSMEDKEKYKQQVLKMKKDLDGFYKSFKK